MITNYLIQGYFLYKTLFLRVQDGYHHCAFLVIISCVSEDSYPCAINMHILDTIFLSDTEVPSYISLCHSNLKIGNIYFMYCH